MIKIINDLFDIAWRLKSIDADYELYYNRRKRRFEVWASEKLQTVIPFERLDARAVDYVRSTRIEYAEKLLAQLDAENGRLRKKRENDVGDRVRYKTKQLTDYLAKGGKNPPDYEEI